MVDRKNIQTIVASFIVLSAVLVLYFVCDFLAPLFFAFALAYACSPIVDKLEKKGMKRPLTIFILLFIILGVVVTALAFVIPLLIRQGTEFISNLPDTLSTAAGKANQLAESRGITLPIDLNDPVNQIREYLQKLSAQQLKPFALYFKRFFTGAGAFLASLLGLVIIPVFFFFFLRDLPIVRKSLMDLIPAGYRPMAHEKINQFDMVLAGYIRGQLLVASILAVILSVGLTIIGVRFGFVIGIASGFLNIIPYVGQLSGLVLSLIMVFVGFSGWGQVIAVPILFGVTNFIEGTFITPKIVGNKVGLPPVWAIIALIIGGQFGGIAGMIMAIPVAGCIRLLIVDLVDEYKKSPLYKNKSQ